MVFKSKATDRFIGTWSLVAYVEKPIDGTEPSYPMGENPKGIIIYTSDGYMSAQIMHPERPLFISGDWSAGSAGEYRKAVKYIAYSGRFYLDENNNTMVHEVIVSLFPNWVDQSQHRIIKWEDDLLQLCTAAPLTAH